MNETCSNVNAECVNSVGSYSCQCMQGYTGDGDNCTGQSNNIVSSIQAYHLTCKQIFIVLPYCYILHMSIPFAKKLASCGPIQ